MTTGDEPAFDLGLEAAAERGRVALCLSGGGFRAALFHLGVLRRLAEVGLLARVDTVSAVSGGSVVAAFLADRMVALGAASTAALTPFEEVVAAPFRELTGRDLRSGPVLRHLLWSWATPGPLTRAMVDQYRRHLTALDLARLPPRPRFVLCATDVAFGVNFVFSHDRLGDYQLGYATPPAGFPLAFAVAASACFPPIFGPLALPLPADAFSGGAYRGADRARVVSHVSLCDGGVYDNLGLEPALRNHTTVIVSDAGGPFPFVASRAPLLRYMRYPSLVMKQVSSLRRRQLMALIDDQRFRCELGGADCRLERAAAPCPRRDDPRCRDHRRGSRVEGGAFLAIDSDVANFRPAGDDTLWPGYPRALVKERVARVRTDLDRFTAGEQAVLENHGYCLAAAAVRRHLAPLLPTREAAVVPPHPELMDPARAAAALRSSHHRFSLGRVLGRD